MVVGEDAPASLGGQQTREQSDVGKRRVWDLTSSRVASGHLY